MPLFERERVWEFPEDWRHPPAFPFPVPAPKRQRTVHVSRDVEQLQSVSILFVDGFNEVRSVMAQAQAEMIRLKTLNDRGFNLFTCLDSAGLRVSTSLTRKGSWKHYPAGRPANRIALDALMRHPHHREGQDLEHRFKDKHVSRGLDYEDFDKFDYIVTFDKDSLSRLRTLEWIAYRRARQQGRLGLHAKTKLLGEYHPGYASAVQVPRPTFSNLIHRSDFEPVIHVIDAELHNMLRAVAGLHRPERASPFELALTYRSRQFLAHNFRVTDMKLRRLKYLYNRVYVDEEIEGRDTRVVTVTAREEEKLREALEDARLLLG
ncbi:hypothetical protein NA57DRAFT_60376 [Rhizodiscina lignyota]|uniref:protein-tyrosine-phosphatase n=1 Tax=Rhizodiscina lignyota TaxID=1504668 RepID=A0A9P4I6U3_9PEZI|nr:hypothetical protein NA57DRAFT_60376 [Rhizodiscina lignyota]